MGLRKLAWEGRTRAERGLHIGVAGEEHVAVVRSAGEADRTGALHDSNLDAHDGIVSPSPRGRRRRVRRKRDAARSAREQ